MGKITIFTEFYLRNFLRSRLFLGIFAFILIILFTMIFLSYKTLNFNGYDSFSYVLGRVRGIEKIDLVYFLWTVPYSILVVFSPAVLAAFVFSHDIESGEAQVYYSYPISRVQILVAKLFVSFLLSIAVLSVYEFGEALTLSIYFKQMIPLSFLWSYFLSIVAALTIISVVSLCSSLVKNSLFTIFFFFLIYFVIFNIINIYSEIVGGTLPDFLLNNDVNSVAQVFSQINLIPFGNAGAIQGISIFEIIRDTSLMSMYASVSFMLTLLKYTGGDVA